MPNEPFPDIPLPSGWEKSVKSAVMNIASMAHVAITAARGWAANSINARLRLSGHNDRLKQEIQLLREEIRIKDQRLSMIDPRRRPHYPPVDRMAILQLKATRGWSLDQAARRFLVEPATIASWLKRLDEQGHSALVQLRQPVNKFPDFVGHVVRQLKVLCPSLGKVKIAQVLARAGLHLAATTAGRMLKAKPAAPPRTKASDVPAGRTKDDRVVTAKYPNQLWHVDLTVMPTGSGFWTRWLPFSLPQCWPFCWWIVCAVDHFSRKVVGTAVFRRQPDGRQVRAFLAGTIRNAAIPKYIICDKGSQFWCKAFKRWCKRRKIKPRFGAIGRCGSIAVIERFIRTMKQEGLRRLPVPLDLANVRRELAAIVSWYNQHRPHTFLRGRTPDERYRRGPASCRRPRWEPRPHWPRGSRCATPQAKIKGIPGTRVALMVDCYQGRKHLPIVRLKLAA